ncbi:MAG: hypothetical protein WD467_02420 [Candidatus Saccharimonadales bacterium]
MSKFRFKRTKTSRPTAQAALNWSGLQPLADETPGYLFDTTEPLERVEPTTPSETVGRSGLQPIFIDSIGTSATSSTISDLPPSSPPRPVHNPEPSPQTTPPPTRPAWRPHRLDGLS